MKTKLVITVVSLLMFCAWKAKQANDHEFLGKSYVVKEKDTLVFENIRLVQEQDELYYIPMKRVR